MGGNKGKQTLADFVYEKVGAICQKYVTRQALTFLGELEILLINILEFGAFLHFLVLFFHLSPPKKTLGSLTSMKISFSDSA